MRADLVSAESLDTQLSSGEPNIDEARGASAVAISDRLMQVKLALAVIKERPVSGIGAGNFPVFMLQVGSPIIPNFVHNVPLLLAAEVGLLGAGLWLTIWVGASTLFIRLWRKADCWLVVTLCAGIALVIISLFDFYPWGLNSGRLLTAMVLGMFARALELTWSA
jgi:O-antigen ligase